MVIELRKVIKEEIDGSVKAKDLKLMEGLHFAVNTKINRPIDCQIEDEASNFPDGIEDEHIVIHESGKVHVFSTDSNGINLGVYTSQQPFSSWMFPKIKVLEYVLEDLAMKHKTCIHVTSANEATRREFIKAKVLTGELNNTSILLLLSELESNLIITQSTAVVPVNVKAVKTRTENMHVTLGKEYEECLNKWNNWTNADILSLGDVWKTIIPWKTCRLIHAHSRYTEEESSSIGSQVTMFQMQSCEGRTSRCNDPFFLVDTFEDKS
ncbi:hypothetical protein C1646_762155 [Rhizophagus diaphanus]|nr:hypothetical protein C1646_762155 [Rhizophagus diaphanus] [Rhizophagus sp. MUCL 43196]